MSNWFNVSLCETQAGEALLVGTPCTGAERWQAAIRRFQSTVNFADILRARMRLERADAASEPAVGPRDPRRFDPVHGIELLGGFMQIIAHGAG